ncbi:MAG: hypothetical protein HYY91_02400 [Candidatus Omnitrophica bacterium]|nr:hypothetical protein [Candidatus Omnitrophota bacterium]
MRAWLMLSAAAISGVLVVMAQGPTSSTCFASQKRRCACPMVPGEQLLIACSSVVDPQSCGVCSVMSADGTRDGRSCITLP